jgi:hypothetical protein
MRSALEMKHKMYVWLLVSVNMFFITQILDISVVEFVGPRDITKALIIIRETIIFVSIMILL